MAAQLAGPRATGTDPALWERAVVYWRSLHSDPGAQFDQVVRLEAAPDTLAERIIAREPPHWSGLAALVAHARTMPAVGGADLVLSTEGARAEDIAARIRQDARL